MSEFQAWSSCNLTGHPNERILWIVGAPGVGKSTLAAYFVEFIQALDKEAILAYFFIRQGASGLKKPGDIARTLAYQCSEVDMNVRTSLETLRSGGFDVDDSLGLHLLATKLLVEPLAQSSKRVYIILDGLEEVDNATDTVDQRRTSMDILIERLCELKSTRLLFLCRPQSVISRLKTQSIFRSIGFSDNKEDIEAYVRKQLKENETLQTRFEKEGIDPISFFVSNSNGIFLWVVLLLEQLSKASRNVFQKYVHDVTEAPNDMTQLYARIIDCLDSEQRKWLREILFWVIGSKRQLMIDELQTAVEWGLQDELANFREFVERQCGSIFLIAELQGMTGTVQIIHETFRSFLGNTETCPIDLQITIHAAHGHLTSTSLEFLAKDEINEQTPIYGYISTNWNYHLIHVKQGGYDGKILLGLYRFFHSMGLKLWLYHELTKSWNLADPLANETEIEDKVLRDVRDWLLRYSHIAGNESLPSDELRLAISWRDLVETVPYKLGEHIGKVSALIWLYEELGTEGIRKAAFELAMRHYWRRGGRTEFNNRDDLEHLISTRFAALLSWAGDSGQKDIMDQNLDIAEWTLRRWDSALYDRLLITGKSEQELWLDIDSQADVKSGKPVALSSPPSSPTSCKKFAAMQIQFGNVQNAIETMKRAVEYDTMDHMAWRQLADAYRAANEYDDAIFAYRKAIDINPREMTTYCHLAEVYHVIGNHIDAIATLEMAVQENPDADSWAGLGRSYRAALCEEKAVECFQRSIEINPSFAPAWKSLVDIYNIQGEFHRTVEAYEKESVANPTCSWVWSGLGDAYCAQKNMIAAIDAYKAALERNSWDCWAWTCLGDACRVSGRHDEAIEAFWTSVEKNPGDSWPWKGLAETYRANDDNARAITIYLRGIRSMPIDYSLHISVARLFGEVKLYGKARDCLQAALSRCPAGRHLLVAFAYLPTSHLFSNYPVISIDDSLVQSLLWHSLARYMQETGDENGALEIYEEVIREYSSLIESRSDNRLLWIYSSYLASRGFDPFEKKTHLPIEILWVILGEAYKAKGDYQQAILSFRNALNLLPSNKWLWQCLSHMYNLCNDIENEMEARKMAATVDTCYSKTFHCF